MSVVLAQLPNASVEAVIHSAGDLSRPVSAAEIKEEIQAAPAEAEGSLKEWVSSTIVDNAASMLLYAAVGYVAARATLLQYSRRKFFSQISIETMEFRYLTKGSEKLTLDFRQPEPEEINEILDPYAVRKFNSALKGSRRDSLSFIMFPNSGRNQSNPHHLIGLPFKRWVEGQIGGLEVDHRAAIDRLSEGINRKSSREMARFIGFFACDKLGSVEQPRLVLAQQEDLVNVLIDLPNWWLATEHESYFEEADNQLRLSRVVEFAVSMATRHPKALYNMLPKQQEKVTQAIRNAKQLEKLLITPPSESADFIDAFLKAQVSGRSLLSIEYKDLPAEYRMSKEEWLEVLRDWYHQKGPDECLKILEKEKELKALIAMPDLGSKLKIPMWCLIAEKPVAGE